MTALLLDDNLMFAMGVEAQLKRLGYAVKTLGGGPAAVETAVQETPDLICVNLASSRFEGPALVRELRAQAPLATTPILGYAGHVERPLFQAGRDAGADLVVPNSAMRGALPEVLRKLQHRLAGGQEDWPEE